MRKMILSTVVIVTTVACIGLAQQITEVTESRVNPKKLFVGQGLEDAKRILSEQKIEFGEGGFAFAKTDPDRANLIVVLDKNHTYACAHYSKSRSKVTGLQMVFFPSRSLHAKGSESWLLATELRLNDDRTYSVTFAPPLTDDELKILEENQPGPHLLPNAKR